jgi:hypothetical protein
MSRHYGLGRNERHHYPGYAPKVIIHRVRHRLMGPLLGCSCSRCFHSRWRVMWSREAIDRFVGNEKRIRQLESEVATLRHRASALEGKPI